MNDHLDKQTLRKRCLAAREKIDVAHAAAVSAEIAKHFLNVIPAGSIVAGYRAIRGEVDVSAALEALHARGDTLCLPVVEHKQSPLVFHLWQPGNKLVKGSYGIDVPVGGEAVIPDVVIVPLAGFDAQGHRLGYGSGYYDQTIAELRTAKKEVRIIGAAYSMQQIESIPAEAHDQRLDMVVTEKGIVTFQ